jgi:hypothetical protein
MADIPVISKGDLILVTGASGFIATYGPIACAPVYISDYLVGIRSSAFSLRDFELEGQ